MKTGKMQIVKDIVDAKFLPFVRMPSRYIGGEVNQILKDHDSCDIHVALCFPDTYEIGMSNTGIAIIYHIINSLDWACGERVFTPWIDAEKVMRENNVPLYTLESKAAVKDFDLLGFSITTELCHTNILLTLELAGIELHSSKRSENDPIILAGGQIANCCEPIADFIDIFSLGEGEESTVELLNVLREHKKAGTKRQDILLDIAQKFEWAYVPSLYEFEYDGDKIKSFKPRHAGLRTRFENAVVHDLDNAPYPDKPIIPFTEAVHERISIEIMRGCPGRCRFCQASYCRRPIRYRSVDRIFEIAKNTYLKTAFDTVSLLSLSTSDYPWLDELIDRLNAYFNDKKVGISLPSLRVAKQLELVPKMATSVRKSGLTIAVEAASEKLRRLINKPVTNENLFNAVEAAYQEGFQHVKLYFMVGFPSETEYDIREIVDLAYEVAKLRKKFSKHPADVTAAVSWLIPKPHTPMGWCPQQSLDYFYNAKQIILERKRELRINCVQFKFHDFERSIMESVVARSDRRICKAIETVYRSGARFDLWNETFDFDLWKEAFSKNGLDLEKMAQRSFADDQILPWDHLGGPSKDYLLEHYTKSMEIADEPPLSN